VEIHAVVTEQNSSKAGIITGDITKKTIIVDDELPPYYSSSACCTPSEMVESIDFEETKSS